MREQNHTRGAEEYAKVLSSVGYHKKIMRSQAIRSDELGEDSYNGDASKIVGDETESDLDIPIGSNLLELTCSLALLKRWQVVSESPLTTKTTQPVPLEHPQVRSC